MRPHLKVIQHHISGLSDTMVDDTASVASVHSDHVASGRHLVYQELCSSESGTPHHQSIPACFVHSSIFDETLGAPLAKGGVDISQSTADHSPYTMLQADSPPATYIPPAEVLLEPEDIIGNLLFQKAELALRVAELEASKEAWQAAAMSEPEAESAARSAADAAEFPAQRYRSQDGSEAHWSAANDADLDESHEQLAHVAAQNDRLEALLTASTAEVAALRCQLRVLESQLRKSQDRAAENERLVVAKSDSLQDGSELAYPASNATELQLDIADGGSTEGPWELPLGDANSSDDDGVDGALQDPALFADLAARTVQLEAQNDRWESQLTSYVAENAALRVRNAELEAASTKQASAAETLQRSITKLEGQNDRWEGRMTSYVGENAALTVKMKAMEVSLGRQQRSAPAGKLDDAFNSKLKAARAMPFESTTMMQYMQMSAAALGITDLFQDGAAGQPSRGLVGGYKQDKAGASADPFQGKLGAGMQRAGSGREHEEDGSEQDWEIQAAVLNAEINSMSDSSSSSGDGEHGCSSGDEDEVEKGPGGLVGDGDPAAVVLAAGHWCDVGEPAAESVVGGAAGGLGAFVLSRGSCSLEQQVLDDVSGFEAAKSDLDQELQELRSHSSRFVNHADDVSDLMSALESQLSRVLQSVEQLASS
jgi:hypothetical protein